MAKITIVQMLVPQSKWDIKATYPMTPQYITIHNTANRASAKAEISYMITNNNYVSYHYAVDDLGAIQGLPLDRNAWHCGDGTNGTGNRYSIGVEICYSLDPGHPKYAKSEDNGAILTAMLLKKYGWGIDRVRKHQDWSGKYCPHRILDRPNGWQSFLNKVQHYLNILNNANQSTPQPQVGLKSLDEVAREVLNGKWGNGNARVQNLTQAGYDAQSVQARVDVLLGKNTKQTAPKPKIFTMVAERGKFTVTNGPILVKNEPYVKSPQVAKYENGESMNYDHYTICDGHVWVSYISGSGVRRYVPIGEHNGHKRTSLWGTIQ